MKEIDSPKDQYNTSITTTQGNIASPTWRATRRLTPEQTTTLITQYQAGASLRALATHYALSRPVIVKLLKGHSIQLRPRGLTSEQVDQAAHLYAQGWSLAKIEDKLGSSAETIRQQLRKRGVRIRETWERGV